MPINIPYFHRIKSWRSSRLYFCAVTYCRRKHRAIIGNISEQFSSRFAWKIACIYSSERTEIQSTFLPLVPSVDPTATLLIRIVLFSYWIANTTCAFLICICSSENKAKSTRKYMENYSVFSPYFVSRLSRPSEQLNEDPIHYWGSQLCNKQVQITLAIH